MTVNPGFHGQDFLEFTVPKLQLLGKLAKKQNFSLCVDGNIDEERVRKLLPLGVTNFVIGTALFRENPVEMIKRIKDGDKYV
jgi:ribulose-phosphate 3-epimerase